MYNNIFPHQYHVEWGRRSPKADDYVIAYNGKEFLVKITDEGPVFLKYGDFPPESPVKYLFSVDDTAFFVCEGDLFPSGDGIEWRDSNVLRRNQMTKWMAFAGVTAFHLIKWYRNNRFCGVCGHEMVHSDTERMVKCPECGNMVYPRISPAIILAVYDGDRLLMTKYAGRAYANYALIAGFTEIGETLEETASREAFEETGIHIKNIRYFKNQPWGFSDSILVGFYAELDGDPTVTLQENELSEAKWIPRDEINVNFEDFSLTNDMVYHFKMNDFDKM